MDDNAYTDHSGFYTVVFFFWFIFSIAVVGFARNKGYSGVIAFIIALVFSPLVAFVLILASKTNDKALEARQINSGKSKKCPHCAEVIKAEASTCRYCGSNLSSKSLNVNEYMVPRPRIVPRPVAVPTPRIVKPTFKVAKEGTVFGELNVDEVGELIRSGTLSSSDYYLDSSSNDWVPLHQHPHISQ